MTGNIKHIFHSDNIKSVTWNPADKKYVAAGSGKKNTYLEL
jgi:hypothetical protein